MTVQQLVSRFPEIPEDLHGEALLAQFAETFGDLLQVAQNPGACSREYDAGNHFYLKLMRPINFYRYTFITKKKALEEIKDFVDRRVADPDAFVKSLLPEDLAEQEVKGPGCE